MQNGPNADTTNHWWSLAVVGHRFMIKFSTRMKSEFQLHLSAKSFGHAKLDPSTASVYLAVHARSFERT